MAEEKAKETNAPERYEFQSEVQKLLEILVYSLYQHKEVFLRELISNSVDALNKVHIETLTNPDVDEKDRELRVDIRIDKDNKTLIIEDSGIGMTKEDLVENIGTIAHSGTLDFVKKITEAQNANDKMDLIGQFGVGFYSSFMVAEEIKITTKYYLKGSVPLLWKSRGDNNYTIEETDKERCGTRIELSLKEDAKEFLETWRIKSVIKQHSRFVPFPIFLDNEEIESKEAIWTQPKSTLKADDYNEFYRFFQNTNDDPETHLHLASDGPVQFNSVLYVPKTNTEIYGYIRQDPGVDLYSKKILIQKACPELLPLYFRFVKGVVDSEDIPLNISRETIQNDQQIQKIRKFVLKKVLDHFTHLKNKERDTYLKIWKNFHRNFKEGVPNEYEYQEKLSALLLFYSSKSPKNEYTDLDSYVERMQDDQIEIYYIMGNDWDSIEKKPALEAFKKKDLEVLYLTDSMEIWTLENLRQYKGKLFRSAESADIKIEEDEKEREELKEAEDFAGYLKTVYGGRVGEIKISKRLVDSPCMLVDSANVAHERMGRMMKGDKAKPDITQKILELNPQNKLIKEMIAIHKENPGSERLKTLALLLLDNMILREGILDDVEHIITRTQDIMYQAAAQK
jgi:molecular chaperone HtpG